MYQDLIQSRKPDHKTKLPPIIPIVLYNGDHQWTAATDISQLIQEIPGGLSRYRPSLQYLLLSEQTFNDQDLANLNNLVAALFRLENSRTPQHLYDVVVLLLAWLSEPEQSSLRRAFTVWFGRVLFPAHMESSTQPILEELTEVKNMLAERVKEWNRESLERGLQQGMQQGALQVLTRLLEKKFGPLSQNFIARLDQADDEQIFLWSERILTAEKINDIFDN